MRYAIRYSEEAAAQRDGLDAQRRKTFDRAITALAECPRHEKSVPMGGYVRHVRLTNDVLAQYAILHGLVVILALAVFDRGDALG
ncbi:type II toxin-antitoxin system RelE family toxin [Streptomyces hiroshimensis]|uniref:Type II toxin-antitoxin system RelE/ParE family toxin n=1 Tax=Streptomyces hiroshimensis TaxID=66424 RepID=A0ABQ2YB05_9ACTN|nr:hypothetical protein [Streptomyces hiroshimensis]GGX77426.1 hypothetical protein GCM10010324_23660 [Streptomyces hiroshimensis]